MKTEFMLAVSIIIACMGLSAFISDVAYAHCDTLDGPVIADARIALQKGDVTPVLKWIKKDAESEIRSAFQTALTDRKTNKDSADMKFFETLVRVHRAGEGAGFTGLKPAGSVDPIVAEADKALESGSVDTLATKMTHHLTVSIKEKFDRSLKLRGDKDKSVEAGREYVEAYVEYVHYIEAVNKVVAGKGGHHHEDAEEE